MSRTAKIDISVTDLTIDGARVERHASDTASAVDADDVLARLQAFAAIPSVRLVDHTPRMRLEYHGTVIIVSRSAQNLLYVRVPEASHTAEQGTPESILTFLLDNPPPAATPETTSETPPPVEPVPAQANKAKKQLVFLGALLAVLAVLLFLRLRQTVPEGWTMISDPSEISTLHRELNGLYGDGVEIGSVLFELNDGIMLIQLVTDDPGHLDVLSETTYRYAKRDTTVMVLTKNDTGYTITGDGALSIDGQVYSRLME
ncbi:hypothetical protein [Synoicihabitans lomoniglobus]|uniref:Uncharacterized protein n=1 Tax=Synoicihabitans lomoniglobus TaxID=2909285 RepID=A0AAE9ZW18_9BACT|nr:hypothetical protein [Opitutaceae bacterium LMO-M01]WED65172.1 hypothetical protein PXH66_22775 [Opitutaceae bacterium LMO-M01]